MQEILGQELEDQASPLLLERLRRQIQEAPDLDSQLAVRLARIRTAIRLFVSTQAAERVMARLQAAAPRAQVR